MGDVVVYSGEGCVTSVVQMPGRWVSSFGMGLFHSWKGRLFTYWRLSCWYQSFYNTRNFVFVVGEYQQKPQRFRNLSHFVALSSS